jgi:hypothetical protein
MGELRFWSDKTPGGNIMTGIKTVIITAALLIGAFHLAMAQGTSQGAPGSSGPPAAGSTTNSSGPPAGSSGATQSGTLNH